MSDSLDRAPGSSRVNTPCVGLCSTTFGDVVCRGCFRNLREVLDWNRYDDATKQQVLNHLRLPLQQAVAQRFKVVNAALLKQKLEQFAVRHDPDAPAIIWAHQLLRAGAAQIKDLNQYGLEKHPAYTHQSLPELLATIDAEVHQARMQQTDANVS